MTQRVLITGGASGIGLRLAERFAETGARMAVCDADARAVEGVTTAQPDWISRVADVTNETQMDAFLSNVETAWGGIDVVCANAGTGGPAGRIEDMSYADWQSCVAVNLHGTFLTCRWAARLMRAQGSGLIVITSSTAGLFGYPLRSPYATAKWGLVGLTKTLAIEWGPAGVRSNLISPGAIADTEGVKFLAADPDQFDKSIKRIPSRGLGTVEDIADAAIFLRSEERRVGKECRSRWSPAH